MNASDWYKIFTVNDSVRGRRLKVTSNQGVDNVLDPLTLSDNQGGRRIKVELDAYPSVTTYADLPPAADYPNRIYAVLTSTGTKWIPAWLGGNYYPKGFYLSDGVSWNYMGEFPNQATQAQVDAGVLSDVFVSPLTLANAAKWDNYVLTTRALTINGVTYDLSQNRTWTIDSLPSQTGENGKWLQTNGTIASWQNLSGNISVFVNDSGYITAAALTNYVPTSRTLTINGVGYDLSADRSWTISSGTSNSDYNNVFLLGGM